MDGVALAVRAGWDAEFLLDEVPLEVFQELVLVITKQNLMLQQQLGVTMMASLSALFSKDGADTYQGALTDNIEKIDAILIGEVGDEDDEFEPRQHRRVKKRHEKSVEDTIKVFHSAFARFSGVSGAGVIPSLDSAIKKANRQQSLAEARSKRESGE